MFIAFIANSTVGAHISSYASLTLSLSSIRIEERIFFWIISIEYKLKCFSPISLEIFQYYSKCWVFIMWNHSNTYNLYFPWRLASETYSWCDRLYHSAHLCHHLIRLTLDVLSNSYGILKCEDAVIPRFWYMIWKSGFVQTFDTLTDGICHFVIFATWRMV